MEYHLFTYPNCWKCEEIKDFFGKTDLEIEEYNLVLKEGKQKIREFIAHIKRDDKGAIIIPSLVLEEKGKVEAVLNSRQELEDWLKSKV